MSATITQVIGSAMRRAFGRQTGRDRACDSREVSLLPDRKAVPDALEPRLIANALAGHERLSVSSLVDLVATGVYRDALRRGGSVTDLGVFGPRIFVPDVMNALEAGNGRLWTITAASSPTT